MERELIELSALYPEQAECYRQLKQDTENYMGDLKKMYNHVLTLNMSTITLQLRLAALVESINSTQTILAQDMIVQPENEQQAAALVESIKSKQAILAQDMIIQPENEQQANCEN